jgi:hypothetical protein
MIYLTPRGPQLLLLNVAIGGDLGGPVDDSIFPMTMEVDCVRVYQAPRNWVRVLRRGLWRRHDSPGESFLWFFTDFRGMRPGFLGEVLASRWPRLPRAAPARVDAGLRVAMCLRR